MCNFVTCAHIFSNNKKSNFLDVHPVMIYDFLIYKLCDITRKVVVTSSTKAHTWWYLKILKKERKQNHAD